MCHGLMAVEHCFKICFETQDYENALYSVCCVKYAWRPVMAELGSICTYHDIFLLSLQHTGPVFLGLSLSPCFNKLLPDI